MIIPTKIKILIAKVLYKATSLVYRKKLRIIERDGINYEVDLSEGIELSLFLFGNFQKHVTKNKHLKIPTNGIIFDVGANVGLMALQFAKLVPEGKVFAFEPTHYAFNRLKKNITLNPELAKRITSVLTFISAEVNENPDIKAYSSWKVGGEANKNVHPVHLGTAKSTEGVGAITLNEFCSANKVERLDLIKIDTDGHEYEILKGAQTVISKFRPKIIFEIGQYVMKEKNIDFSFYENYFKKLNYRLLDSQTNVEINLINQSKYIPAQGTIDILALPN